MELHCTSKCPISVHVICAQALTVEERETAFNENHPYREGVEKGYPYLIEKGKYLKAQGINFYDLSMIFSTNEEPLYIDACCHLNKKGYKIIAEKIGVEIIKKLGNR